MRDVNAINSFNVAACVTCLPDLNNLVNLNIDKGVQET